MSINVTRSSMPDFDEYIEEIKDLWDSRWLTNMGAKHNKLQEELCGYLSVDNVSLFTNGHLALEAALAAMKLTGEVITTPFTFSSTTQAIVRCGLTPVFCDVRPEDYTIDPAKLEALITDKTSAIVPVHVYGSICDVYAIERIAKKHGLKVIYDAAHAFGVRMEERGIGSFGDAAMFSFHATKVFNTVEGGCVTYADSSLTERLMMQKNFGMRPGGESYPEVAGNSKLDEFRAAMGLCNLRHVDGEIEKRKAAVVRYTERLGGVPGLKIWREQPGVKHNYAYFPVVFDKETFGLDRDEAAARLLEHGISARKYFYPLTSALKCYEGRFELQETPVAEYAAKNVLTLPLFADLTMEDVDRICDIILSKGEQA
ncbi:MAG: DegT/DnrJ/EryC1/StrS family aminotransferase [Oscillospiraceae bacterium]|nr:DegT/DnrJ/EryC1/StrS family aminotransferase [Oscillospiraceae bacterium]